MHVFPTVTQPPSNEFKKHFSPLHIDPVYIVRRFARFDEREYENNHFIHYCNDQKEFKIEADVWRVPKINCDVSYQEAVRFWEPDVFDYELPLIEKVTRDLVRHLGPTLENAGTLSFEELKAQRLDLSASSGCGYNHRAGCQTKRQVETNCNVTRDLYECLESWRVTTDQYGHTSLISPIPEVYSNQTKWELRKKGKPPRTFMSGPYKLHLTKAHLFQSQNDAMVRDYREIWPNVGISHLRRGWDSLYHRLNNFCNTKEHHGRFWESDFSGWDRSLPAIFIWVCMFVRVRCWPKSTMTRINYELAQVVYYMTIHGFVWLEKGEIVQKHKGMPSGDAMTIFDNCIAHMAAFSYVIRRLKHDITYYEIQHYFLMCLMGDDNLGARKDWLTPWFQSDAVVNEFGRMGLLLKRVAESQKLQDLEYLAKQFVNYRGVWLGKPNREKLLCQVAYGNHSLRKKLIFVRLCNLRIEAFPDQPLFYLIDSYCKAFMQEFAFELKTYEKGTTTDIGGRPDDLSWDMIRNSYLPVTEIEALHLGYESASIIYVLDEFYAEMVPRVNSKAILSI